nr:MAG TPA: hypothetical protein [Caudoviricetes sp.]
MRSAWILSILATTNLWCTACSPTRTARSPR